MGNKALQQCCATSCTKMLPILLGLPVCYNNAVVLWSVDRSSFHCGSFVMGFSFSNHVDQRIHSLEQ